jgi:hypothetical protein
MKLVAATLASISLLLVVSTSSADEQQTLTITSTTTKPTIVSGRVQRPAIAIEISRAKMQLGATTPTLASGMKMHDASKKDPL